MPDVTYRNATAADVPGILALWREFWSEQPYEANLEPKIESEPDTVYVAEADGRIVGTIVGGFDGWWGWLYRIAVTEAYQGQGIGTQLVEQMERRLKAKGATGACAIVSPENAKINQVLQKMGYTDRGYRTLGRRL